MVLFLICSSNLAFHKCKTKRAKRNAVTSGERKKLQLHPGKERDCSYLQGEKTNSVASGERERNCSYIRGEKTNKVTSGDRKIIQLHPGMSEGRCFLDVVAMNRTRQAQIKHMQAAHGCGCIRQAVILSSYAQASGI